MFLRMMFLSFWCFQMLLLAPMQISGANVGVLINRMIPSWLIIGFTIVLLGFSGYTTFVRGIEAYRWE